METGTIINQYKIVSPIGKGGMGEVFLALDTKLDRKVAIKFLNKEFSKDADKLSRFVLEAKAVSALNHPNILTVYEIGEKDDANFIVTEFIEGNTLRDDLTPGTTLSLTSILNISVQAAEALSAAHQAGIIHRDIKPENIMIRKDGYAKVLDFGLAKLTEKQAPQSEDDATLLHGDPKSPIQNPKLTSPGMVMGTVSYMSPEQARGKETDARTDIWSLGVVLYEMLAGKVPFTGETINHTIVSILEKEPKLLDNVPDELQRIVRKALTKDADMRYQTARDLLIDLKNLRRTLDIQGELERSVVPNREVQTDQISENATAVLGVGGAVTNAENPPEGGTPNGTPSVTTSSSLEYAVTQAKTHKIATAIVGIALMSIILAVAYFGFFTKTGGQIESIAVLPFINESGNPDMEYLSDGMTETLINSLSKLPNLNVKPRSSVFRYKGKETNPQTIANELNVQAILTGRVVQRGDQLILSLELIDVQKDVVLWGEQYTRKQSDLVSLQTEIAREVSTRLKSRLSNAEVASVEKNYTADSEAYQLYLKGRYHWNKRDTKEFEKAVGFFKQAIEKDPKYALAYSGLADTYTLFHNYGDFRRKDTMPQAKEAALKALELDPNLAEAHASLGEAIFYWEYDWAGAEQAFKRAIELNPKYATAHQWYSEVLVCRGKFDEGMKEGRTALELDPFSFVMNRDMVFWLMFAKRFDEAFLQNKKTNELFPDEIWLHYIEGIINEAQGRYPQAAEEYIKSLSADKSVKPEDVQKIKGAYKNGGWDGYGKAYQEFQIAFLNDKLAKSNTGYVKAIDYAIAYSYGKDKEKTIEYLNKAFEERSHYMLQMNFDHTWNFVRDDARYKELVKKVGFPE